MTEQLEERLQSSLSSRREKGLIRELRSPRSTACDFSSNDYLGFARQGPFQNFLAEYKAESRSIDSSGSTGSRLLSGHSEKVEQLEEVAARFHDAETGLLFNSGYDANLAILSCLPGPEDVIIFDELIHASMHDGMRIGRGTKWHVPFQHNDADSLRDNIASAALNTSGSILVCIETIYSMDGDVAPVTRILEVARFMQCKLGREIHIIADEAHAGGLYGDNGEGLFVSVGAQKHPNLLLRVLTFGKAFGAHGAVVLTSILVRQYLINYARPFIYSTALPPHNITILLAAYDFAKTEFAKNARNVLWERVETFKTTTASKLPRQHLLNHKGSSPIQGILVPGNKECVALARVMRKKGFEVYPIRSPTVPRGSERIRIIIHSFNTEAEINRLVEALQQGIKHFTPRPRL